MGRRFLLLSDLPPCLNYTGGLDLDTLIRHLPAKDVYAVTVLNAEIRDAVFTPDLSIPNITLRKPRENGASLFRSTMPFLTSFLSEAYAHFVAVPRLTNQIAKICEEQKITDIFCVIQGQTMARLANRLADKTRLPLYTYVWDSIGWWLRANRVDRFWSRKIYQDFARAISRSKQFAATSFAMAEEYRKLYGARAVHVSNSIPASWAVSPRETWVPSDRIRIGFSGQMYAQNEFNLLVKAIESVDWKLSGKTVEIHVFGRNFNYNTDRRANMVFHGWHCQEGLVQELSALDILYCPYGFDPSFADVARSSFPSKVTVYFAAARPILFHGPSYSSVAALFNQRDCGVACASMDQEVLLEAIRTALDPRNSERFVANARKLFEEVFTTDAQRKAFHRFLEVRSDDMVSIK